MPRVAFDPLPLALCSLTFLDNLSVVFLLKVILPLGFFALSGLFLFEPLFWSFLGAGVLRGSLGPGLSDWAFLSSS